ncbi:YfcE family phosphodiesterase, partial [bacterium]|nr:YfcE family phosphodiesterase [bacterium]
DTHLPEEGPLPLQLLSELEEVDFIVHLGDFNDLDAYKEFQKIAPLVAVYGNLDTPDIRSLVPEKKQLEVNGHTIGIIHGWGPKKNLEKRVAKAFDNVDIVLFGHTHVPFSDTIDDKFIFNPGSATCNADGSATYGILELGASISHKIIRLD